MRTITLNRKAGGTETAITVEVVVHPTHLSVQEALDEDGSTVLLSREERREVFARVMAGEDETGR